MACTVFSKLTLICALFISIIIFLGGIVQKVIEHFAKYSLFRHHKWYWRKIYFGFHIWKLIWIIAFWDVTIKAVNVFADIFFNYFFVTSEVNVEKLWLLFRVDNTPTGISHIQLLRLKPNWCFVYWKLCLFDINRISVRQTHHSVIFNVFFAPHFYICLCHNNFRRKYKWTCGKIPTCAKAQNGYAKSHTKQHKWHKMMFIIFGNKHCNL